MSRVSKQSRRIDDWRQWNKDRKKLFSKNGNGWWWLQEGDEE